MTLVIMAAGLASRYGGAKQIERVGPGGAILMEYTIHDAMQAGFARFVIVLKPDMLEDFRQVCGRRLEGKAAVAYAFQSFESLPEGYRPPEGRVKPYGTVPAVLCAKGEIQGRFAVVNADDYYGPEAYRLMYGALAELPETGTAAMVAYRLKNTVSRFGTVTRGVCTVEDGRLTEVRETYKIHRLPDGSIRSADPEPEGTELWGDSPVSMNFWGFTPWMLGRMEEYFEAFLAGPEGTQLKSECLLPVMVGEMIRRGELEVRALTTAESWFGMTYQEDRATTAAMLQKLTEEGLYPAVLF